MGKYNERQYRDHANSLNKDFQLSISSGFMHDLCDIVEALERDYDTAKGCAVKRLQKIQELKEEIAGLYKAMATGEYVAIRPMTSASDIESTVSKKLVEMGWTPPPIGRR